jgi:hypothetical protein
MTVQFQAILDREREYKQAAITQGRVNFDVDMWKDSDPTLNESDIIALIEREHDMSEKQANRAYRGYLESKREH